ncbi:MAG: M56 family metallopeptidase [Clostridia bacterium]
MQDLFLQILNMSISASYLILVAIVFRLVFKKAPKFVNYIMWGFVGFRMLCPFSLDSMLSILPTSETFTQSSLTGSVSVQTGINYFDAALNEIASQSVIVAENSMSISEILTLLFAVVWAFGVVFIAEYAIIKYLEIRSKVKEAAPLYDNIYRSEAVDSPFVLGIINPKIYIPSNMNETDLEYVLAHENTHLKHFDHIIKPIAYLCLCVHWFNPLAWLAFHLMCKDIELCCDESVVKTYGKEDKKAYSFALVNCSSVKKYAIIDSPLAFGETSVKTRVKAVLSYKKPRLLLILASLVCCVGIGTLLLTNPIVQATFAETEQSAEESVEVTTEQITEVATTGTGSIESYENFNNFQSRAMNYVGNFYISAYKAEEMPTETNYGGNDVSISNEIMQEVIEKYERINTWLATDSYDGKEISISLSSPNVTTADDEEAVNIVVEVLITYGSKEDDQIQLTSVEQLTINSSGEIIDFTTISSEIATPAQDVETTMPIAE